MDYVFLIHVFTSQSKVYSFYRHFVEVHLIKSQLFFLHWKMFFCFMMSENKSQNFKYAFFFFKVLFI